MPQEAWVTSPDAQNPARSTDHAREVAEKIQYGPKFKRLAEAVRNENTNLTIVDHSVSQTDLDQKNGLTQIIRDELKTKNPPVELSPTLLAGIYKHLYTKVNIEGAASEGKYNEVNVIEVDDVIKLTNGHLTVTRKTGSAYTDIDCDLLPTLEEMTEATQAKEEEPAEEEPAATEGTADKTPSAVSAPKENAKEPLSHLALLQKAIWTKEEALATGLATINKEKPHIVPLEGWKFVSLEQHTETATPYYNFKVVPDWPALNAKETWTLNEAIYSGLVTPASNQETSEEFSTKEGYRWLDPKEETANYKIIAKTDYQIPTEKITTYTGEGTFVRADGVIEKGEWQNGNLTNGSKIDPSINSTDTNRKTTYKQQGTFDTNGNLLDGTIRHTKGDLETVRDGKTPWKTINDLVAETKLKMLWGNVDFKRTRHPAEENDKKESDPYPFYSDGYDIKFHEEWNVSSETITDPSVAQITDTSDTDTTKKALQALCDIWKMEH